MGCGEETKGRDAAGTERNLRSVMGLRGWRVREAAPANNSLWKLRRQSRWPQGCGEASPAKPEVSAPKIKSD